MSFPEIVTELGRGTPSIWGAGGRRNGEVGGGSVEEAEVPMWHPAGNRRRASAQHQGLQTPVAKRVGFGPDGRGPTGAQAALSLHQPAP